jgi:hypothetical protein
MDVYSRRRDVELENKLRRWVMWGAYRTLAFTLSKEGGLTIEKQIKKTSVCG